MNEHTVVIGQVVRHLGDEWFREMTLDGVTFLVPLDRQESGRHILGAAASWIEQRAAALNKESP